MISDEKLKEWERLANDATRGPWFACGGMVCTVDSNDNRDTCPEPRIHCAELKCFNGRLNGNKIVFPDQKFAAAAREAVPALIAEVRRLQEVKDAG